jgi:hypothetical protein
MSFLATQLIGFAAAGGGLSATAFSKTLATDSSGWSGYTMVQALTAGLLTLPSFSPVQTRITLRSGSTVLNTNGVYIGHGGGVDAYDFGATPTQVTFSGSGSIVAGGATTDFVSDWVNFPYDKVTVFLLSMQFNSTASIGQESLTGSAYYVKEAVQEAATVNKASYTTGSANVLVALKTIEFRE